MGFGVLGGFDLVRGGFGWILGILVFGFNFCLFVLGFGYFGVSAFVLWF